MDDDETIEKLRRRNEFLTSLCKDMAEFLAGFMSAAGKDDPKLMELPDYVAAQKRFAEMRLYLEKTEGDTN